ncbi:hypothetical protein Sm713_33730 [Streptomyces sp. TS71-3]|nr:hypothetical protein Sm713_33730 [Streptomyces sp. TS71-3]
MSLAAHAHPAGARGTLSLPVPATLDRGEAPSFKGRGEPRDQPQRDLWVDTGLKGLVSVVSRPPAGGWLLAQFPAPLGGGRYGHGAPGPGVVAGTAKAPPGQPARESNRTVTARTQKLVARPSWRRCVVAHTGLRCLSPRSAAGPP